MKVSRVPISKLPNQIAPAQVQQSVTFLQSRRPEIAAFDSVEDLAVSLDDGTANARLKGFEHHFIRLRNMIARKLWSNGLFIGNTVIESLLFHALKDPTISNPVEAVFRRIEDFGLHRHGFVLYPLHSFGILEAGIGLFMSKGAAYFIPPDTGIAISPQTNSNKGLLDFLSTATESLRIKKKLPVERMEDFLRTDVLKWLTHNPVLVVRCRVFSGTYYENQFLLVAKLKIALAFATMLFTFQKNQNTQGIRRFFSTSSLNNFETLDLKHYLVFEAPTRNRTKFSVQRVPMNLSKPELAELSELAIELDPREWKRRPAVLDSIRSALAKVEAGYLYHCIGSKDDTVQRRVHFKLFDAINHFRRSFRQASQPEPNIISLTIAFETLLTDNYAPGVSERIARRVGILLKGIKGERRMRRAVRELYNARSEGVHKGRTEIAPDWASCRQAFVYCLVTICKKLHKLPSPSAAPIGELLGDQ